MSAIHFGADHAPDQEEPFFGATLEEAMRWLDIARLVAWLYAMLSRLINRRHGHPTGKEPYRPLPVVTHGYDLSFGRSDAGAW
jgi:hypothetical protein